MTSCMWLLCCCGVEALPSRLHCIHCTSSLLSIPLPPRHPYRLRSLYSFLARITPFSLSAVQGLSNLLISNPLSLCYLSSSSFLPSFHTFTSSPSLPHPHPSPPTDPPTHLPTIPPPQQTPTNTPQQFYASLLATSASTSSSPTTVLTPTSTSTLSPTRSRSLLPHPETAESHFGAFSVDLEGSAPDGQSTGSGKDNGSGSAVGKAKGNKTGNGKAKGNGRGSSGSGSLTMREVAEVEWRALREALGRVLEA